MVSSTQIALMSLGVAIVSLIVSIVAARVSNLESRRQREDYLNRRFEERKWINKPFVYEFDTTTVKQKDDFVHQFRRLLLGEFHGITEISVYANVDVSGFWENEDNVEFINDIVDTDITFVEREPVSTQRTRYIFRLDTSDYEKIESTVDLMLKALESAVDKEDLRIGPQ